MPLGVATKKTTCLRSLSLSSQRLASLSGNGYGSEKRTDSTRVWLFTEKGGFDVHTCTRLQWAAAIAFGCCWTVADYGAAPARALWSLMMRMLELLDAEQVAAGLIRF